HWFTFVDPGRLEVSQDTLDTLTERGNMDILINFHSTGVKRASASSHSRDSAERYMGTSKLQNGKLSEDEYAELYCERVGQSEPDWTVDSTAMIDPHNDSYRFDMVFATIAEETAMKVMQDIWNKEGFWNEARRFLEKYREGSSQSGIGDFV
ncbi:MAG: hypothetical protein ABEI86_09535, partial [Halobacteriaceae archaeon]